jgi:SEC-C motif-containing protein
MSPTIPPDPGDPCPCRSGSTFSACCGPVLDGSRDAGSAEALMRSRFTAFALRDLEHLLRSWDAEHRPAREELADSLSEDLEWRRLRILDADGGGPTDSTGVVEFVAIARGEAGKVRLHERSRFRRTAEHPGWVYVDGDVRG